MKKKWIVVALTACAIVLAGCKGVSDPEPIAVESVTLNETTLTLAPGATRKVTAVVMPDNADDKTVEWSSSNTAVAMVDNDGMIGAIKTGTATITAQAGDKTATCTVTVKPNPVAVESITFDATTLTLASGTTRKLIATVTPDNADDKTVVWSSSNAEVAMVDNDGTIEAIKTGTATITAKVGEKQVTCTVTVKLNPIVVESVTLSTTTLMIEPGKTRSLTATVTPNNADDKTVTWFSSDENIATVSDGGTVTAHAEGIATITAKVSGKEATCVVTVNSQSGTTHVHYYSLGICTVCGFQKPFMLDGTIDDNGVFTNYRGAESTVTIPDGVIGIGSGAFENCESLKKVSIPGSVMAIGSQAFKGCSNLNTLEISTGLTGIGSYAFDGCTSLVNVSIPDSVSSIGDYAFSGCTKLTKVTIPTSVTSIGEKAFAGCDNLGVIYSGTLAQWCALEIDYYFMSYAKSIILAGENNLDLKTATTLTIPNGVTSIGYCAFARCTNLANVIIPTSVTEIGSRAFYGCENLATVQYGGTLAQWCSLDNDRYLMFYAKHVIVDSKDLKSMTDLVIPNGVKTVENYAFSDCTNLKIVSIPDSVTSIGSVFVECTGLTSMTIPSNVKNIGDGAFAGCTGLKSVTIPNSVTSLGAGAFARCDGLISVTIPDSVTSIEMMTFYNCTSLTEVTISECVMSIGDNAFDGCKNLTSLTIPKSVKSIGRGAFMSSNLTSVDIPASVTRIGEKAFSMTNLSTVKYGGTQEQWNEIEKGADIFSWTKGPTITGSDGSTWTAE